jgi:uncharacterized protein (DUF849 family)
MGVIEPPFWLQFIFGLLGGIGSSVDNLVLMKNTADKLFGDDYIFSVLAAGRNEFSLGTIGAIMGGSVRVGLEDNLYLRKGELAKSNADMVHKMVRILRELSIEHASPQEARKLLNLKGKQNTNF